MTDPYVNYGFDDMRVGDVVRIASSPHEAIIGAVSQASYGKQPEVTAFGEVFDVYREHAIELIYRPDPVADAVSAWNAAPDSESLAKFNLRRDWPRLAGALDRLAAEHAAEAGGK
jgi:hypothetical protein